LLCLFHPRRWFAGGFLCLSGIAGVINSFIKWAAGRTRPFKLEDVVDQPAPFTLAPFRGGLNGLFHQKNLAFTSGHACIAFATAAALAILMPRWRWAFYACAAAVAAERVLANAHYLSDTVAAAGLAILVVHLIWRCWQAV